MGGVVLAGPERHRRFSDEQKIAIVGESFLPGVRVREAMDRYGLASSVIYTWRKQARAGHFGGGMFAPVTLDFSRPGKPTDNAFIERSASRPFGSTASSALNV